MQLIREPVTESREVAGLSQFQRRGTRLWSYRLSATDIERLQRSIAAVDRGQTSVSIAVGVDACRRGSLGSTPLPTSTFLRTNDAGFLVLTEDLDLRSVVPERDLVAKIPSCSSFIVH